MCSPSALGDAALAPANAPTPDPGGQPGLRGAGGGFVALSGAVRLASKWAAVSAGRSGSKAVIAYDDFSAGKPTVEDILTIGAS